uniref:Uncharacterized protein n=1 Tax=Oryza nivara TaxID=4536 RepID=A0A0E0G3M5_ORYNI
MWASPIGTRSVGVSTEQETPTCRIEILEFAKSSWNSSLMLFGPNPRVLRDDNPWSGGMLPVNLLKERARKVTEITKLWWQLPMEAVPWKIEPPHVCEVAQCRADHTKKVEVGEVQRHHTATTASSQATRHSDASACVGSLLMSDLNDMSARRSMVDEESKAGDTWLKKHERKTMASKRSSWVWSIAIAAIVGCLSAV